MRHVMLLLLVTLMAGCAAPVAGPPMISVPQDSIVFERMPFVVTVFRLRELYLDMRRDPAKKCETDAARNTPACVKFKAVDDEAKALWTVIETKMMAPLPAVATPQSTFDVAAFGAILAKLAPLALAAL